MSEFTVPKGWVRGEELVYIIRPAFKHQRWAIGRKKDKLPTVDDGPCPNHCYALDFASGAEVKKFAKWWYGNDSPSKTGRPC